MLSRMEPTLLEREKGVRNRSLNKPEGGLIDLEYVLKKFQAVKTVGFRYSFPREVAEASLLRAF